MFKTGICSVSFRKLQPQQIIKLAAEAGLDAIEWGSDVHASPKDKAALLAITEAQTAAGLHTSSYGTYFRIGTNSPDELHEYIEAAKILGTDTLRIWCGSKNYSELSEEERCAIISESKACAKIAESHSAILALECHPNTFTDTPEGAIRIMEEVDSPAFKMYWQRKTRGGDKAEDIDYLSKIVKWLTNIHVFEYHGGVQVSLSGAVGDWCEILSDISDGRTLLLEFIPTGEPEALLAESLALRRIVEEHSRQYIQKI